MPIDWPQAVRVDEPEPSPIARVSQTAYTPPKTSYSAIESVAPTIRPRASSIRQQIAEGGLKPVEGSSVLRRVVGDTGISLLKGVISGPEAAVGLLDIPTGGRVGKAAEAVGFRPKEAKEILTELESPELRAGRKAVSEGFKEGIVPGVKQLVEHPAVPIQAAVESLPLMGAGGVVARGLRAATGISPIVAGIAAESIRQQSPTGTITPKQAVLAGVSGVGTALFGAAGGKLAKSLDLLDQDMLLAGGINVSNRGVVQRIIGGEISEGLFEVLPQSTQEQVLQNLAVNRPAWEGVGEAGVTGAIVGGLMGAGFNVLAGQVEPVRLERPWEKPDAGPLTKAVGAGVISGSIPDPVLPIEQAVNAEAEELTPEEIEAVPAPIEGQAPAEPPVQIETQPAVEKQQRTKLFDYVTDLYNRDVLPTFSRSWDYKTDNELHVDDATKAYKKIVSLYDIDYTDKQFLEEIKPELDRLLPDALSYYDASMYTGARSVVTASPNNLVGLYVKLAASPKDELYANTARFADALRETIGSRKADDAISVLKETGQRPPLAEVETVEEVEAAEPPVSAQVPIPPRLTAAVDAQGLVADAQETIHEEAETEATPEAVLEPGIRLSRVAQPQVKRENVPREQRQQTGIQRLESAINRHYPGVSIEAKIGRASCRERV